MKSDRPTKPDPRETPEDRHARQTMDPAAYRNYINQSLARKIAAWARFHERCRHGGCRRNARCLAPGNCRVVRDHPPPTDEERLAFGRKLKEVLKTVMEQRQREGIWPPADRSPPRAR